MALEFCRRVGFQLAGHFDRDEMSRWSSETLWTIAKGRVAVCIVNEPYQPIRDALVRRGFKDVFPFYDWAWNFRDVHPLQNGWSFEATAEDVVEIGEVQQGWSDYRSKASHFAFRKWHENREELDYTTNSLVTIDDRYFIPEVVDVLHDHEVFIDGGAYDGSVSRRFMELVKGKFKRIACFEPDVHSFSELLKAFPDGDKFLSYAALSDWVGLANFHEGYGHCSRISGMTVMKVPVITLDKVGLEPSFIKLHLEGGELAALKGARETLVKHRPIVAATVYHNNDGMWRTARWLMDLLEDYRFLFRLHGWQGTGAVIYAIPKERGK